MLPIKKISNLDSCNSPLEWTGQETNFTGSRIRSRQAHTHTPQHRLHSCSQYKRVTKEKGRTPFLNFEQKWGSESFVDTLGGGFRGGIPPPQPSCVRLSRFYVIPFNTSIFQAYLTWRHSVVLGLN